MLSTPDALRRVARLQVRTDRLRGWIGTVVVPLVADLAVKGRLEHLVVWIRSHQKRDEVHRGADDLGMFERPPLEGFLRVLADPYLLSARLWVDGEHAPTWCRFHGPGGDRGREAVVEIDWREVLRVVDPEKRDIAVSMVTERKW